MTTTTEGKHVNSGPSSNASLRLAVLSVDLQFYKGSRYKLRWGSPGGLDHAIPAYQDALRTLEENSWAEELVSDVEMLKGYLGRYIAVLEKQDVTHASALYSPMMATFEALRDKARLLPG
jgi:hypothetical protein